MDSKKEKNNLFLRFLIKNLRKFLIFLLFLARKITLNKIPPIPVASVLIERKGKILGVIRSDGSGIGLPAGIINWNETPKQAAKRETLQETGLNVEITELLGVYSNPKNGMNHLNILNIVYLGKNKNKRLKSSIEGKPKWFSFNQIFHQKIDFRDILEDYLHKKDYERKR